MRPKEMLASTCVAGVVLFSGAARLCSQSAQRSTGTAAPQTTEHVYKNIQVLKDVPADQLIPAMQFITASLGVQCDFCHQEKAFEKDDKETKQTAADYRSEGGVKTPFRWTVARPNGSFTIQIEKMQQNVPIEDDKFAKPGQ